MLPKMSKNEIFDKAFVMEREDKLIILEKDGRDITTDSGKIQKIIRTQF